MEFLLALLFISLVIVLVGFVLKFAPSENTKQIGNGMIEYGFIAVFFYGLIIIWCIVG